MFWLISFLISVLILGTLMFFSYPQKREREDEYTCWNKSPWVDAGDKRVLVPVWMVVVAGLVSIIPVINLILTIAATIIYCAQYKGTCGNEGYDLEEERMVLRAPYLQWFKWLNKEI